VVGKDDFFDSGLDNSFHAFLARHSQMDVLFASHFAGDYNGCATHSSTISSHDRMDLRVDSRRNVFVAVV